ncbi:MAG TPA: hypothetical protein VG797_09525 [Phycisphaerales bacterium]|nr:hypothetical protein [Phycisphaerales bacterium]
MSELSPLHPIVYEKFRLAFGDPHRAEGKDRHWGLRALNYIAAINVLVNGSSEHPVVWVFDPHDPKDGVSSCRIRSEAEIDPLIKRIEERVRSVGRSSPP